MYNLKIFLISFFLIQISFNPIYSQMKFGAGVLRFEIDGKPDSIGLNTNLTDLYFEASGGNVENGLIKFMWTDVKSPSEIKPQTILIKVYTDDKDKTENRTGMDSADPPIAAGALILQDAGSAGELRERRS